MLRPRLGLGLALAGLLGLACSASPNTTTGGNGGNGAGGGTGWLQTTAPVEGSQEFELLFTIWDTSDSALDSLVLIDKFEWIADGGTVTVVTRVDIHPFVVHYAYSGGAPITFQATQTYPFTYVVPNTAGGP